MPLKVQECLTRPKKCNISNVLIFAKNGHAGFHTSISNSPNLAPSFDWIIKFVQRCLNQLFKHMKTPKNAQL